MNQGVLYARPTLDIYEISLSGLQLRKSITLITLNQLRKIAIAETFFYVIDDYTALCYELPSGRELGKFSVSHTQKQYIKSDHVLLLLENELEFYDRTGIFFYCGDNIQEN